VGVAKNKSFVDGKRHAAGSLELRLPGVGAGKAGQAGCWPP
jgi:hypothetical protein